MTYIATANGWLYLAVLLDLFSGRVVGWATRAADPRAAPSPAPATSRGQALRAPPGRPEPAEARPARRSAAPPAGRALLPLFLYGVRQQDSAAKPAAVEAEAVGAQAEAEGAARSRSMRGAPT